MKKRFSFSVKYALLCTFTMFLMATVMAKHYKADAGFIVPVSAAALGTFLAGWISFKQKRKKFQHLKTGILALALTFVLSWLGFWLFRNAQTNSVGKAATVKAFADAWKSFLAGILIMVPAFILLVYVAEGTKKETADKNNGA